MPVEAAEGLVLVALVLQKVATLLHAKLLQVTVREKREKGRAEEEGREEYRKGGKFIRLMMAGGTRIIN